ncbi:MAG: hypothetical protein ABI388_03485 [Bacteroidia bacterium]
MRDHGKHNKSVCDKLHLQDEFKCNDWVITTAFYSAIHYLDHALFPYKHSDGSMFNDINDAHKVIRKQSKHQTREYLVNQKINHHAVDYNFLMSECWNARYSNYDVNPAIANLAVKKLESIIKFCDK